MWKRIFDEIFMFPIAMHGCLFPTSISVLSILILGEFPLESRGLGGGDSSKLLGDCPSQRKALGMASFLALLLTDPHSLGGVQKALL